MLTAMGESLNKIEGLKKKADDYVAKPFEPEELYLRIRNLLELFNQNLNKKNEFNSLNDFNNLHTTSIDYENILFLYNQNLVTKELIKPLYLS